jgi:hypothetical protein
MLKDIIKKAEEDLYKAKREFQKGTLCHSVVYNRGQALKILIEADAELYKVYNRIYN